MEEKGSSSSSRWNPTKEQITVLEGLYKQGMRTPTAEQIQQIAAKLREYGEIEGKNVFYWFQNHKARQRQRKKQEGMAYYSTRMMSRGPGLGQFVGHGPLPHPPQGCGSGRAMRPPYCFPVPPPYPPSHYPSAFIPAAGPRPTNMVGPIHYAERSGPRPNGLYIMPQPINSTNANVDNTPALPLETLELFPLHPTRASQAERSSSSLTSATGTSEGVEEGEEVGENSSSFYNFFG